MWEAKYPWIRDDVFLVARVIPSTGQQQLCMQQIDLPTGKIVFEDSIDCIHTAVCDISAETFDEVISTHDFEHNILDIESSEPMTEIHLLPAEKFRALKSWVAGIADAGEGAFRVQAEIEQYAHLVYPIANRLLRFAVRVNPSFLGEYLQLVCRDCRYDGVLHYASLRANLIPIINVIEEFPSQIPQAVDILEEICDILEEQESPANAPKSLTRLWVSLGTSLHHLHQYAKAAYAFEKSIEICPEDGWVRDDLVTSLIWAREHTKGLVIANEAILRDPRNYVAWNNLAYICRVMGDYHGALKACLKSISLDKCYFPAWITLGRLRFDKKDFEAAIADFKKVIRLNATQAKPWYLLGISYKEKGDIKSALRCFKEAASLDSEFPIPKELVRPKPKIVKTDQEDYRNFSMQHVAGRDRKGIRAERTAAIKRREYDDLLDLRAIGRKIQGIKDAKSNRHHGGTRRREAYRAWRRNKRLEQPADFLTVLAH